MWGIVVRRPVPNDDLPPILQALPYIVGVMVVAALLAASFAIAKVFAIRSEERAARSIPFEEEQRRRLVVMNRLKDRGRQSATQLRKYAGLTGGAFNVTSSYLKDKNLVAESESEWKPKNFALFDNRVFRLTAQGIDEVERGRESPKQPTENLGPQILVQIGDNPTMNTGPGIAVGGQGNKVRINVEALDGFVAQFRNFLDQVESVNDHRKVEAQLDVLEAEVNSDEADPAVVRSVGGRLMKWAEEIAVGAAGNAAYEGLIRAWHAVFS